MHTSSLTGRHAGGTSTPSGCKQSGLRALFWLGNPVSLVPQRAIEGPRNDVKPLVRPRFRGSARPSGTKWHGGPLQSIRDLGRTR